MLRVSIVSKLMICMLLKHHFGRRDHLHDLLVFGSEYKKVVILLETSCRHDRALFFYVGTNVDKVCGRILIRHAARQTTAELDREIYSMA